MGRDIQMEKQAMAGSRGGGDPELCREALKSNAKAWGIVLEDLGVKSLGRKCSRNPWW